MPVEFCTFFNAVCILDQWDVLEPARKSSGGHSIHFKCACVRCLHDDLMKAEPFFSILCFLSHVSFVTHCRLKPVVCCLKVFQCLILKQQR
jgi:hypothetical protein